MGMDTRIGSKFLNPGPGYGGSCFPKDTNAMAYMARKYGVEMALIETTIRRNDERKIEMAERILSAAEGIAAPKIGVLGLAFKGGTDDCRESPAMEIVAALIERGAVVRAFDPKAMPTAKLLVGDAIEYASDACDAAKDADVVAILTEWDDFKAIDLKALKNAVKSAKIVDLRNILNPDEARQAGFDYRGIGR